jgi:hypothetical protein
MHPLTPRAVLEDLGEPAEMSPPPMHDVRDQPFMDEFHLLNEMDDCNNILDDLDPQPMGVNRWELVLSPKEYLNRFKDSLADIQLISRALATTATLITNGGSCALGAYTAWIRPS